MKIEIKDQAEEPETKAGEADADVREEPAAESAASAAQAPDEGLPDEEKTYKEQLQRLAADFDNFRKRTAKEKQERFNDGVASLACRVLPGIDNLALALASAKANHDQEALLKGIEMVQRLLEEGLEQAGVKEIDVSDGRFDPRFHETLFTEPTAEVPPDTILLELQKGYTLGDRLIRPTKVKTSVAPPKAASVKDGAADGEDGE